MEEDEIIFTGEYKDFRLGVRFGMSGKKPEEAAAALAFISSRIEPHAFRFSGIDTKKIEAFAKAEGKGLGAVCSFFDRPAGSIREALSSAIPRPELMDAAESFMFNRLLDSASVPFKAAGAGAPGQAEEKPGDFIGFIGKYGSWIAIKKLGLENVKDYEVSGILSGINHTIVNKAFEFAGAKNGAPAQMRRSYGNAGAALRALKLGGGPDSDAFAVCKALEAAGYKPYASPDMLTEAYPDIKPPKVRGRKPKG